MAHRACIMKVIDGLGIPMELSKIIAGYAKLSDDERLEQFFRFGDTVKLTVSPATVWGYYDAPHTIFIQDTKYGIEISSTLTKDDRERISFGHFVDMMNSGELDLDIFDDIPSRGTKSSRVFDALEVKLINYWHFI